MSKTPFKIATAIKNHILAHDPYQYDEWGFDHMTDPIIVAETAFQDLHEFHAMLLKAVPRSLLNEALELYPVSPSDQGPGTGQ